MGVRVGERVFDPLVTIFSNVVPSRTHSNVRPQIDFKLVGYTYCTGNVLLTVERDDTTKQSEVCVVCLRLSSS
jgi:hypothetical protein